MDLFKSYTLTKADTWDWNCPKFVKRNPKDTKRLHKIARQKMNLSDKKEINNCLILQLYHIITDEK